MDANPKYEYRNPRRRPALEALWHNRDKPRAREAAEAGFRSAPADLVEDVKKNVMMWEGRRRAEN